MSYIDIFILGWNLNALMFVVNLLLAVGTLKSSNPETLQEQSVLLNELQSEFQKYYPNRKLETIISYLIPFTAFLRVSFRLVEMFAFFSKNRGTTMYDFMVYKYSSDIQRAKNRE